MCIFLTFKYHSQLRIRTMSFAHVVDFRIIILHFYKSSNFVPSLMSKIYRNKILQRMRMSQIFISSLLLKKHLESSKNKIDIQTLCLSTFPRSLFTNNILKYLVQIVPLLACDILWKKNTKLTFHWVIRLNVLLLFCSILIFLLILLTIILVYRSGDVVLGTRKTRVNWINNHCEIL